ncbi:hypothetical protein D3C85_1807730 [compost metagenome]
MRPMTVMADSNVRLSLIWSDNMPSGIWKMKLPIPITVSSSAACDSVKPDRVP